MSEESDDVTVEEDDSPRDRKRTKTEDNHVIMQDDGAKSRVCKRCNTEKLDTAFGQATKILKDGQKQQYRRNVCKHCNHDQRK